MAVKSRELPPEDKAAGGTERKGRKEQKRRRRTAVLRGDGILTVFLFVLRVLAVVLMVLSALGTFYALQGADAPVRRGAQLAAAVWADLSRGPVWVAVGVGLQALLTLAQWGTRQAARDDRRWWFGYLAALAPSVYMNWSSIGEPLAALGWPWLLTFLVILAGDVFPEFILVADDDE